MGEKLDMAALWKLSYGLYIVSSTDGERQNGQIANAVIQVTAEPPQIAVALNKKTLTHSLVEKSGLLSVSILDEEAPITLIGLFGFKSGREIDKFSQCHHSNGAGGCPIVLDHTTAVFEGVVRSRLDVGTHTIFVAEITAGEVLSDKKPMTYDFYHTVLKGKASENAPTYRGANKKTQSKGKKMKYECDICGWIYDPELGDPDGGIEPGTDFEDIPEDWVCPVCGAEKDAFSPVE